MYAYIVRMELNRGGISIGVDICFPASDVRRARIEYPIPHKGIVSRFSDIGNHKVPETGCFVRVLAEFGAILETTAI